MTNNSYKSHKEFDILSRPQLNQNQQLFNVITTGMIEMIKNVLVIFFRFGADELIFVFVFVFLFVFESVFVFVFLIVFVFVFLDYVGRRWGWLSQF